MGPGARISRSADTRARTPAGARGAIWRGVAPPDCADAPRAAFEAIAASNARRPASGRTCPSDRLLMAWVARRKPGMSSAWSARAGRRSVSCSDPDASGVGCAFIGASSFEGMSRRRRKVERLDAGARGDVEAAAVCWFALFPPSAPKTPTIPHTPSQR